MIFKAIAYSSWFCNQICEAVKRRLYSVSDMVLGFEPELYCCKFVRGLGESLGRSCAALKRMWIKWLQDMHFVEV
jgi:hypothetical protein